MAVIEGQGSRYLEGNYGPVADELTVFDLEVDGAIPPSLSGRYLRIGPNPWPVPEGPYHWFSGAGMVHGVELRDGRAQWYRNRWVRTSQMAEQLGEPDPGGPTPPMYDASNTNVLGHGGRIYTFTEGSNPYELTPELDTVCRTDFCGVPRGFTAHPKIDPVTGELLGFAYGFEEPYVRYHAIGPDGRLTRTVDVDTTGPVMMHDFSVTERHAVFYDLPVVFSLEMALDPDTPFPFRWDDDYPPRVGLLPRDGDAVRWFDVDPCYVFHPLNAYEDEGGRVVLDVVRYPDMFRLEETKGSLLAKQRLERWTVDPSSGKVLTDVVDDRPQEFPQVDPRVVGRRHRFGYVAGAIEDTKVLKHDLVRGTTEVHDLGAGRHPGEFSFVPDGDRAGEDEGWLVGFVYDDATDRSDLVLLDASDMAAAPVATIHLPRRVPFGFHGSWVAD